MKYFRDTSNVVYAFAADGSQDAFIPEGLIQLTKAQLDALRAPTAADTTAQTLADKNAADVAAAKNYAKLTALRNMTPAQVQSWVAANVTNLAQAQDAIATLAVAVSVLSRRL